MKNAKNDQKNKKAASILRTLDSKDLAEVSGGGCPTCGRLISASGLATATLE